METKLQMTHRPIETIREYNNNPRINDKAVDAVAASIEQFGFKNPIIIDKDGVVIAGHTRLKAAWKLGLQHVPTIVVDDLTEEQIRAFRIADNKTAELAEWDIEKLHAELESIENIDLTEFGITEDDLRAVEVNTAQEDDVPIDAPTRCSVGDTWALGSHRLVIGDSRNKKDVQKLMQGGLRIFL